MKIYLASRNIHKKKEISEILPEYTVLCPGDMNIKFNPEENGSSFTENALIKAKALWEIVNEPVLADDSGICVDALNGEPGIYSSRYGSTPAHKLSQEEQNCLLLEKMKGNPHRNCRFVCAMVLYLEKDRYYVIQETLEGTLAEKPIGKGGFGYDPLVFLPDLNKTVAQLTEEEKNNISHRGKALKILKKLLA